MKSQKLIGMTAIAYLLLGGQGAAMADITCTDNAFSVQNGASPVISGEIVNGNVIAFENCIITASVIKGDIRVDNTDAPRSRFALDKSIVAGQVIVAGGAAVINSNIISSTKEKAILIGSVDGDTLVTTNQVQSAGGGTASIVVTADLADSAKVLISDNTVSNGSIKCLDVQDIKTYAVGNTVPRGEISCFGQ